MLLKTIAFEIPNLNDFTTDEFLMLDTVENREFVFSHHYTREIRFIKTFDFEFAKKERVPAEYITDVIWLYMLETLEMAVIEETDDPSVAGVVVEYHKTIDNSTNSFKTLPELIDTEIDILQSNEYVDRITVTTDESLVTSYNLIDETWIVG